MNNDTKPAMDFEGARKVAMAHQEKLANPPPVDFAGAQKVAMAAQAKIAATVPDLDEYKNLALGADGPGIWNFQHQGKTWCFCPLDYARKGVLEEWAKKRRMEALKEMKSYLDHETYMERVREVEESFRRKEYRFGGEEFNRIVLGDAVGLTQLVRESLAIKHGDLPDSEFVAAFEAAFPGINDKDDEETRETLLALIGGILKVPLSVSPAGNRPQPG